MHRVHAYACSGHTPGLLPARHAAAVAVANLAHDRARAGGQPGERVEPAARQAPAAVGDRMTVRVLGRVLHVAVDRVEHALAHVMLEHLGVLVHLGPVEPEHLHEERLEDPVTAHHAQRFAFAFGRELRRAAVAERNEVLARQPREHVGHAGRGHFERASEFGDGRRTLVPERVDRLQVILAGSRQRGRGLHSVGLRWGRVGCYLRLTPVFTQANSRRARPGAPARARFPRCGVFHRSTNLPRPAPPSRRTAWPR